MRADASSLAKLWQRDPIVARAGTCAEVALWDFCHEGTKVFAGVPDPDTHILCVMMDGMLQDDLRLDGRKCAPALMTDDVFSLVPAGAEPLSEIATARGTLLHIYLPARLLSDSRGRPIELRPDGHHADRRLRDYAVRLHQEIRWDDPASGLAIDSAILGVAAALARCWPGSGARPDSWHPGAFCDRRLARVMERLASDLAETPRLELLAAAEGITPRHLHNLFHEATGQSPHRWLTERRIERARHVLASSDDSVTDVAMACGFSSAQHFATAFRRHVGASPVAFRRTSRL